MSASTGRVRASGTIERRRPLVALLHALNQPLTGLQCGMEVALAGPRSNEQYAQGVREWLELTGRMRDLVHAIREVADADADADAESGEDAELQRALGWAAWKILLQDVVEDLRLVAEAKRVCVALEQSESLDGPGLALKAGLRKLQTLLFRLIEAVLSLSAPGSKLWIVAGDANGEPGICIRWQGDRAAGALSRPELGLLVAEAGWERVGGAWRRERAEERMALETITLETITLKAIGLTAITPPLSTAKLRGGIVRAGRRETPR